MNSNIVNVSLANIILDIPDFFGKTSSYKVIWMREIEENFYEISLQSVKDSSFTMWLIHLKDSIFTLLSCTLYFNEQEMNVLKLADKLHLSGIDLRNNIYKQRISQWKSLL